MVCVVGSVLVEWCGFVGLCAIMAKDLRFVREMPGEWSASANVIRGEGDGVTRQRVRKR